MLYTKKGDNGTTKNFNAKSGQRISKSSCQTEALGALDELNSFLGLVKVKATRIPWRLGKKGALKSMKLDERIHWVQECLFSIQAEVAGADKRVGEEKVTEMEVLIDSIEKQLPPITTFFISGGTELASLLDVSRTLTRKAERRVVAGSEEEEFTVDAHTLAFLNRLSSLFYALARLTNHLSGINESAPSYR